MQNRKTTRNKISTAINKKYGRKYSQFYNDNYDRCFDMVNNGYTRQEFIQTFYDEHIQTYGSFWGLIGWFIFKAFLNWLFTQLINNKD